MDFDKTLLSVDEYEAAKLLGCTVSCLRAWRFRKVGPRFIRIGRLVRYRVSDLQDYQELHLVNPATESAPVAG